MARWVSWLSSLDRQGSTFIPLVIKKDYRILIIKRVLSIRGDSLLGITAVREDVHFSRSVV